MTDSGMTDNAKRIKNWIRALRSGKYRQSRLKFHGAKGGHCCLGVAQIVERLEKYEDSKTVKNRYCLTYSEINKLIKLNDNDHRSFAYIADHIQKNILPRFLTKS